MKKKKIEGSKRNKNTVPKSKIKYFGHDHFMANEEKNTSLPSNEWNWKPSKPEWLDDASSLIAPKPWFINKSKAAKKQGRVFCPRVLLIGRNDPESGIVFKKIFENSSSVDFLYLDWDHFVLHGGKVLHSSLKQSKNLQLNYSNQSVDLSLVKTVWYSSAFYEIAFHEGRGLYTEDELLVLKRWSLFINSISMALPNSSWFPGRPDQIRMGDQDRIADFFLARELKMCTPDFCFTNDLHAAKRLKAESIYPREFSVRSLQRKKRQLLSFPISNMKSFSRDSFDHLEVSPVFFQQRIDKSTDLRIVVVKDVVLACEIDARKSKSSAMDWRNYDLKNTTFKPFRLPVSVRRKLVEFMRRRRLSLASFDLVKDRDNQFWFLEMNRPGKWLFIEALSGLQISNQIVKALLEKR
jgi:hypothetical protein